VQNLIIIIKFYLTIYLINMPLSAVHTTEEELKEIKKSFRKLMRPLKSKLKGNDEEMLTTAYKLAVNAHKSQRRKSGEPYVLHPLEVARIAHEEIGLGPTAIICAILHDVVEDTPVTLEEIKAIFGDKVAQIVDGLTKLDGTYNNAESPQAENLKKVLGSLLYDVRVVLIKMADRMHNMRTIGPMPRRKQLRIAAETSFIYAPLAHRLGLYNFKNEFEDICMKITEPDIYSELEAKIEDTEVERSKYIKLFVKPIKKELLELKIPYRILGRSKSISSVWNKIKNKNVTFEEIYDLFAIRIIADVKKEKEKNACWQVYSVITDVYKPIPERLKDWITTPKSNGYESLHTTVIGPKGRFVEVQIRSERMDAIAERGFAAHWKYKSGQDEANVYDSWLDGVRGILDQEDSNAIDIINDFKSNLFSKEVYAFTPAGDMKVMPEGSTALDFAFEIHTDIGYKATAIKVNNKLVPMGYKLQNGDQVHVTTGKNQKPNENWLNMAVTGKARSKIRSSMKEERRKKGEYGKESLQRKLKNMKVDYEDNIDFVVKQLGFASRPDLYYSVYLEDTKMSALKIFENIQNKLVLKPVKEEPVIATSKTDSTPKRTKKKKPVKEDLILVNGEPASMYQYSFSKCCNPVKGDDIFAYLTSTTGLKIHRTNCPNATHIMANYGYRALKAEWSGITSENFLVDLLITGVDSGPGVIQLISNELSVNLGVDIRSFSIEGDQGYFEGKVGLVVKNKKQLSHIIHSLNQTEGISSVKRLDKEQ